MKIKKLFKKEEKKKTSVVKFEKMDENQLKKVVGGGSITDAKLDSALGLVR
ncbi:MAG: bacteriocin [Flavobacteriales bacterium]|nr:bacteriocin [Flavobacteriales bacterium]